ncbi:Uncharacterized protein PCOAH_00045890 [Plasmodium coatneyi]|uniref:Uncharacterized protein n=1 Tax=Plasmodium coatneyi TaxID=208452 RepID=A0A1B1E3F1_9APIC|nr:Uncharacterized protein PCOAH_00045890 [Plasmodium coatneyi]ANQ09532.1 Uncharacterized protein PCOAH_00045890 [Plasmodium coatneyi]
MTLIRKVNRNVLQTFKELYRTGKRLNIHKTTFLSQTYEKNCWRKTRLREEKVYHKKYNFLKYAYDVVNYGIENNLKFQIEEKNIVEEEDSYIEEEKKDHECEKSIKEEVATVDMEIKNILKLLEDVNRKYNQNTKNATQIYYHFMNRNVPLKKSEFFKKYQKVYNAADSTILYYYIKKFKLLTNKKKHLTNKLRVLKMRKNAFDSVNYSFSVDKLEEMFYEHARKINVL